MKIRAEHLQVLRDAILALSPGAVRAIRGRALGDPRVKDLEKRVRWDLLHATHLSAWICATIYPYADDKCLDTALRAIMKTVEARGIYTGLTEEDHLIFRARTTVAQMAAYLKADRASANILHGFAVDASSGKSQPKRWAWLTWSAYERARDAGEI